MNHNEFKDFVTTHFEKSDFIFLNAYALGLWLAQIMAPGSWRFANAALKHNLPTIEASTGKIWKDSLLSVSDTNLRKFYSFCDSLSFEEFSDAFIEPGVFTQGANLAKTETEFKTAHPRRRHEFPILIIKAREIFEDISVENPLEKFRSLSNMISNEILDQIFICTNLYPFGEIHSRKDGLSARAIRKLRAIGCDDNYIMEKYIESRSFLCKEKRERKGTAVADTPSHMVRAAKDMLPHIGIGIEETLDEAYRDMTKISRPSDFIGALLIDKDSDDTKLDCGFLRFRFLHRCTTESRILLINPSPYFLQQFPEQFHRSTTCVYFNERVCKILSHEFFNITFVSSLEEALSTMQQFNHVLFFSSGLDTESVLRVFAEITDIKASFWQDGEIQLTALLPIGLVNTNRDLRIAATAFRLGLFSILPDEISLSVPRKKVLFWGATRKGSAKSSSTHSEVIKYHKFNDICYLNRDRGATAVEIPSKNFTSDEVYFSLRKLTNSLSTLPLPDERQRDGAKYSQFSRELKIWYKVSDATPLALKAAASTEETNEASHEEDTSHPQRFKVEAYVCYFPTESQLKRNTIARGVRLDKSYASKITYSQDETNHWLRDEAPYAPRIHDGLVAAFNEGRTPVKRKSSELRCPLLKDPISLRTIWYVSLTPDDLRKRTDYFNKSRTLMESSVGDLLAGTTDRDEYVAAMESFFVMSALTVEQCQSSWRLLSSLLTAAVKRGFCKENPIAEVAAEYRQRHTSESDIRDALTKKTFTVAEEIRLFQLYPALVSEDWTYFSVMLRHFTGLSSNELAGLQWGDLKTLSLSALSVGQLCIQRQAVNDGSSCKSFENAADCRPLPLLHILYEYLSQRKAHLQEKYTFSEKELQSQHIFLSDAQIETEPHVIPSPRHLNQLSRKVVQRLGLEPDIIILPDDGNGTKESNLTYYHGDIFRSNFDFRVRHDLKFTLGQLNYWLGRKQKSTYPKHYCDFGNALIQLQMIRALEDWPTLLQPSRNIPAKRSIIPLPADWSSQQLGHCTGVEFAVAAAEDGVEFEVHSSSSSSLSISANIIEKEDSYE